MDSQNQLGSKWWVDTGRTDRPPAKPGIAGSTSLAGMRFYKVADGFEQESAREKLTDNNLKVLLSASPEPGTWKEVALVPHKRAPKREVARVIDSVALPAYARGVIVDCGQVLRLLVTGTPIGERILELALVEPPSFDAWVEDEWVEERLFPGRRRALREFRQLIRDYLSPDAIALQKSIAPAV